MNNLQLLLISNSTMPGEAYLGYCKENIAQFLGDVKEVLFIPYAGVTVSYEDYTANVAAALNPFGIEVTGIHTFSNPINAVESAKAIIVGGGNTFELLSKLYDKRIVEIIRKKVMNGTPYIGWSAGSNMACPTIKTTNDMPITMPISFKALNLIHFQINPHYTEERIPNHGGESRAQRLQEFLTKNTDIEVLGLPEGTMVEVRDGKATYLGEYSGKVFFNAEKAEEVNHQDDLSFLLK
ncbi:dipeptidase PepE [Persicobacter diffluens]|uniref:dipeptidase E n=1 Tax=Persicobacter diffluens TaxID=981 RepID=A0AAN4VU40_9BACT|nr:peptidase E [Persicobacter diffluens]